MYVQDSNIWISGEFSMIMFHESEDKHFFMADGLKKTKTKFNPCHENSNRSFFVDDSGVFLIKFPIQPFFFCG